MPPTANETTMNRQSRPRWLVAVPIITCAGLSLVAYAAFLRHGVAPAVVGYNLAPSERVLQGQVPYRDFLYNYTPGVLWLNSLLFRIAGATLMTARVGVLAAKIIGSLLLFLLGRRFLGPVLALLPVAMTLAWIGYGDVLKVFPTQYGMPLLIGSCLAMMRASEASSEAKGRLWLFGSGLLIGLVFAFKHNVGIFAMLALIASALLLEGRSADSQPASPGLKQVFAVNALRPRLTRAAVALAGFALITLAVMGSLASQSALRPMISHMVRHAAVYGEAKGIALPGPLALLDSTILAVPLVIVGFVLYRRVPALFNYFLGSVGLLVSAILVVGFVESRARTQGAVFGLAALAMQAATHLNRSMVSQVYYLPLFCAGAVLIWVGLTYRRSGFTLESWRFLTLALFAGAAFLEVFPRSDPDHLVRILPLSLLLFCALLNLVQRRPSHGLFVLLSTLVIALGISTTWAPQFEAGLHLRDNTPLDFVRGSGVEDTPGEAARLNELVAYIDANSQPGEPILALSRKMTALYFFAARPNITRLTWPDSAGIPQEDRQQVQALVVQRQFKLIIFGADSGGPDAAEADSSDEDNQLLKLVEGSYRVTESIHGARVFSRQE